LIERGRGGEAGGKQLVSQVKRKRRGHGSTNRGVVFVMKPYPCAPSPTHGNSRFKEALEGKIADRSERRAALVSRKFGTHRKDNVPEAPSETGGRWGTPSILGGNGRNKEGKHW